MTDLDTAPAVDKLPPIAWVMAWLFLAGQAAMLIARGPNTSGGLFVVVSMLLSAVIVRWFADGVLRGRTVRLTIVWILLSAAVSLGFVGLVITGTGTSAADLATFAFTLAQLVALGTFCTTSYFRDRRASPNVSRAALAPLLVIAVATGLLGGLTAPAERDTTPTQLWIKL